MLRDAKARVELAAWILDKKEDPSWGDFRREWTAFNALYGIERKRGLSEEDSIDRTICRFFDATTAAACLKEIDSVSIRQLRRLPPGDDRLLPSDRNTRWLKEPSTYAGL